MKILKKYCGRAIMSGSLKGVEIWLLVPALLLSLLCLSFTTTQSREPLTWVSWGKLESGGTGADSQILRMMAKLNDLRVRLTRYGVESGTAGGVPVVSSVNLPPFVIDQMHSQAIVQLNTSNLDAGNKRLGNLILRALNGEAVRMVALGGSQTYMDGELDSSSSTARNMVTTWPGVLFTLLNATFPHKDNSFLNGAIPGAGGAAPLLCLPIYLSGDPNLVLTEFHVNPTSYQEATWLYQSILALGSDPAVLGLVLWSCIRQGSCSLSDNEWQQAAAEHDVPMIDYRKAFAPFRLPNDLCPEGPVFSGDFGVAPIPWFNSSNLCIDDNHHWNVRGLQLIGRLVFQHVVSLVMIIDETMVRNFVHRSRQPAGSVTRTNDVLTKSICLSLRWGMIVAPENSSEHNADAAPAARMGFSPLKPVTQDPEWEFVKIRLDKEMFRSRGVGSKISFELWPMTKGILGLSYMKSLELGSAEVLVNNKSMGIVDAHGSPGFHLLSIHFVGHVLGPGRALVTLKVLDSNPVGFGLIGLSLIPCLNCSVGHQIKVGDSFFN
eukprot:TRINITY_DN16314_c0_g1_i1.p1 TRINITY_DN16314_c0_g1~~TRINITY_DN16314_c0_g1_i1.p1  ORF type:complete len:549 (+),score=-9.30 TRINITY_DN16314_c0_g1_i1:753-2399(+)